MLKQTAKKKAGYIYERKALSDNNKALYEQIIEDCKPTNTKGNAMKTIALKVNRIKNTLMSKIDKMFESIGYYFKGFKYDIKQNNSLILELKSQVNNLEEVDTSDIEYRLDDLEYYDISSLNDKIEEVADAVNDLDNDVNVDDIKSDIKSLNSSVQHLDIKRNVAEEEIKRCFKKIKKLNDKVNFSIIESVKVDNVENVTNELILNEFSTYLCDNVDLVHYDYNNIKRDVLIALIDCKEFEIRIKRVNK